MIYITESESVFAPDSFGEEKIKEGSAMILLPAGASLTAFPVVCCYGC